MIKVSARRVLMALPVVLAFATFPTGLLANHAWGNYHWSRASNPFTVKLGKNVGTAWKPYLKTASNDWNQSSVLHTTLVPGGTTPASCLPTNGRVEVCAYTYGNNGWLGLAQIWVDSKSHIYQGTAQMNKTYFQQPQYNTPAWKRLVMCQEVGHTFGLDHQDTNFNNKNLGTCMDYTSNPEGPPDNEHPDQHDYDELVTIYTHFDTFDAADGSSTPPAMNDIELSGPGQWGKVIRGSRESGTSVYELDFGGGNKVFTFVTWAK